MVTQHLLDKRVSEFVGVCRARGLRMTPQRLAIYEVVAGTTIHPSAEDVYAQIHQRMPNVSLDTIYRTLHFFEEEGLVDRVDAGCDSARFDAGMVPHHHFICKICGKIVDFEDQNIGAELPDSVKAMGRIDMVRLVVRGVCTECETKN